MKLLIPLFLAGTALAIATPQNAATEVVARSDEARDATARCPGNAFPSQKECNRACPGKKQCRRVQFPSGPVVGFVCPCPSTTRSIDSTADDITARDDSLEAACPKRLFHDESKCNRKCPGRQRCNETEVRGPEGAPIVGWKCACASRRLVVRADGEAADGGIDWDGVDWKKLFCPRDSFSSEGKCNRQCPNPKKRCHKEKSQDPGFTTWKCPCGK